jgi:hypothetical protein
VKATIIDIVLKTAGIEKEEFFPDGLFAKKALTRAFNNTHLLSRIVRPIRSIESWPQIQWFENYGKFVVEQLKMDSVLSHHTYSGTAKIHSTKEDWKLDVKWTINQRDDGQKILSADTKDASNHRTHFDYNIKRDILYSFTEQGGVR